MARQVKCDFGELKQLRNNLARLERTELDKFCVDMSKELAARLLALVIPATPVGVYPEESGKQGGTLRRGWTAKTHEEAVSGGGQQAYSETCVVSRQGRNYVVEIINPVEYASYVEYGHRTRGGDGWVSGRYFLTMSEQELRRLAPGIIEKKLENRLRRAFNV